MSRFLRNARYLLQICVPCSLATLLVITPIGLSQEVLVSELERTYDVFDDALECRQAAYFHDFDTSITFRRDGAQFHIILSAKETEVLDLGILTSLPNQEQATVTLLWPNTGERVRLAGLGSTVLLSSTYTQQVVIAGPPRGAYFQIANSGSDVPFRLAGSKGGEHDGVLLQEGLNGLQAFTTQCMD